MAFDLDDEEYEATRKLYKVDDTNVGDIEEHINNLKEYCRLDRTNIEYEGDFGEFCKGHIEDIEAVLSALENSVSKDVIKAKINEVKQLENTSVADLLESEKEFCIDILQELLNKGE
jgi:hypothetical protein